MVPPERKPPLSRELPARVTLAAWLLLTTIPVGILLLVVYAVIRRGGGRLGPLTLPLMGMGLLIAACLYVIAERLQRARWQARAGKLCTRCGYDVLAASLDRCPECGSTNPTRQPYIPIFERLHPALRVLIVVGVVLCSLTMVWWILTIGP